MKKLLVLRPEPGASQTRAAARAMGLETILAPLFVVEALAWSVPAGDYDGLMLTSANAVRWAGEGVAAVKGLPVFAVGEATATVARDAGLNVVHTGSGGAAALVPEMRARGVRRVLHLAGEVHREVADPGLTIDRVIVYRSVPVAALAFPDRDIVALIHSPNAGCLFAQRTGARSGIAIAAISAAAAAAAGEGWDTVVVAPKPTDAALLAIAAKLCEKDDQSLSGRG